MRSAAYLLFSLFLILSVSYSCYNSNSNETESTKYRNHSADVSYVGKEICKGCHPDIYASFSETGMGQSWGLATRAKSASDFKKNTVVFDSIKNLYYHPQWMGDTLQVLEFRLEGKDTIYQRKENIKYIVGSGQHTNSHIYETNGFLFQAPLTFYTQSKQWNLPPGFEGGNNSRFGRAIELECMNCHNAISSFDIQSQNRYNMVQLGLNCENCHGPGSLHVQEKQQGKIVDIKKEIDYTIVNPAKLPWSLQIDVCQRCHLQGNAILHPGKTFTDFIPGMKLSSVVDVYMPHFEGDDSKFIMASHAERLQKSKCFLNSNTLNENNSKGLTLTCITCHNPHISVKVTGKEVFNNACKNCHQENSCSAPALELKKEYNNCVKCHMPQNGTSDIPHVMVHDHYIRKPLASPSLAAVQQFAGIKCINNKSPTAASQAEGYLNYYEKFNSSYTVCLDSALFYLPQCKERNDLWVHYYYLRQDYSNLVIYGNKLNFNTMNDAWTTYRVAEGFIKQNDYVLAEKWINRTVALKPKQLNFLLKQGNVKYNLNKTEEAKQIFETIINFNPKYAEAWSSLGLLICNRGEGDIKKAMEYYNKALALDPDLESALINSLDIFNVTGNKSDFLKYLRRLYKLSPHHQKLVPMYKQFNIH
ncbi:MAG: tetratricopeptide repeat protein [Bacteroidetes bacterium]|nr:tetratricopeptide repeat protein [Bacteroidota bacterium]